MRMPGPDGAAAMPDLPARLKVIGAARRRLADQAAAFAASIAEGRARTPAEALVSEVLPLLDAIRFLEREAASILAPRRVGRRGRPLWLAGSTAVVRREPLGTVLIVAPSNYPLLLPGVQLMQALAAGNTVRIKPAPGCSAPMRLLAALLERCGLPPGGVEILGEAIADVDRAIAAGPDKVVLTGSVPAGRAVLAALAGRGIPSTMELSGCDAAFVCDDADPALAAEALLFGLRLNGSATCIAPRRVFCAPRLLPGLVQRLEAGLPRCPPVALPDERRPALEELLDDAARQGARIVGRAGRDARFAPALVLDAAPSMALLQADVFAPVLSVVAVAGMDEALRAEAACPFALGASVFGRPGTAAAVADRVTAGVVVINDVIVPTVDPRLPFGGRRASGFGVTRGREGLLEMTAPKVTITRTGRFRPHFQPPLPDDEALYLAYVEAAHGTGPGRRARAAWRLLRGLARRGRP